MKYIKPFFVLLFFAGSCSLPGAVSAQVTDWRNVKNGHLISSNGYCDQPYVVVLPDRKWLVVFTTNEGHEGSGGQHIVSSISVDQGKTWSKPVQIEHPGAESASWAMPYLTTYGRVYVFYDYNGDKIHELNGKKNIREDMLGWYCYKYSDDGGLTWSERHRLDVPNKPVDRRNDWNGKYQIQWGIGKPVDVDKGMMFAFSKIGKYLLYDTEGWFFRCDNINTEKDQAKLKWVMLPEGETGVKNEKLSPTNEEQNIFQMNDGALYCMERTISGHPAEAYSRDGGKTWTTPQVPKYLDGIEMKNPRACPRIWKCKNGKYLFWYHNNGSWNFKSRNPAWVSGGIEKDGKIIWSQPEILLYEEEIEKRMSYPDLIEQDGKYWITETNKEEAKCNEVPTSFLNALWSQFELSTVAEKDLVKQWTADELRPNSVLQAPQSDYQRGFTLDAAIDLEDLAAGQKIAFIKSTNGKTVELRTGEYGSVEVVLSDGVHTDAWHSDPGLIPAYGTHAVTVIVDNGPKIIQFVVDGTVCNGRDFRQYGWGTFTSNMGDMRFDQISLGQLSEGQNRPAGKLSLLRLYNRPLMNTEAIGNYRNGKAQDAGIALSDIYSDNMVIQAGAPFCMNGSAAPLALIRVRIGDQTVQDTADVQGNWMVRFPAFKAGNPFDIAIEAGAEKKLIRNVIAGEVWLCSGQSNMEMTTSRTDVKNMAAHEVPTGIRYFIDQSPVSSVPVDKVKGYWVVCTPGNAGRCSAVGLSFALNLAPVLGTTVGLVINARGGTPIESWTNGEIVKSKDYNQPLLQDREQWKKDRSKYEQQYAQALKDSPAGVKVFPPFQMRENWEPGSLYRSLIYPIRTLAFKGVIWYQGESNANYPLAYRSQLTDLIHCWRDVLKDQQLPFYIIQLPEYGNHDDWAIMRESQASVTSVQHVWDVVSLGLGDSSNIHPTQKMELGRRVALRALAKTYGRPLVSSGPVFQSMRREGKRMVLTFACEGSAIRSADRQPIRNMEIAGTDLSFLPAAVRIEGNRIVVWNEKIGRPAHVRYAWKNVPSKENFTNSEGLPAAPFRASTYDTLLRRDMEAFTTGVFSIERSRDGYVFNRYPEKAIKLVSDHSTWEVRAHCTSGVALRFITHSEKLFLSGKVLPGSPQTEPFHVFCNGMTVALLPDPGQLSGNFSVELPLPQGNAEKEIRIAFPAYSQGMLQQVGILEGTAARRKEYKGRMLALGNSITQMGGGYEGFLTLTANDLGYSLYDAGIGGHVFQASYLTGPFMKDPTVIVVEYGTNDWSGGLRADSARPFLKRLCGLYPGVPVVLIEPLYRFKPVGADDSLQPARNKAGQSLEGYREDLKKIAGEFKQVVLLDHTVSLPKDPALLVDGVHPGGEGQRILAQRLTKEIRSMLTM
jgi:hypothetical protein